ncbi:hypothetical protein LCGC14_0977450 [marine sediment metagenome]|uniref:DUF4326 domain-containing protein n=1 Tax=marine sediment metagenome TaxID=412755 RepID=A0A0F9NED1_9ZZZZ
MNQTTVVNLRFEKYDVYIGRAGKGQTGTFGNPYYHENREDNIKLFKKYFYKRLKSDQQFAHQVLKLKGKRLGCFCRPANPCHGDIIADYLNNLPEVQPLKLAVVGSRNFHDYEYVKSILDCYEIKQIISGGAKGADTLAKRYAAEHSIDYKEFPAEWNKYGKSAGPIRNRLIVDAADEVVAFMIKDQATKGTSITIKFAEEKDKPVHIYKIEDNEDISTWGRG